MKPHEFHPDAEFEMLAQADYLESREAGVGVRFLMAVDRAIQRLKHDAAARPRVLRDVRHQPIERFKLHILYLDEPDRIWIVAIAHYSRKTAYWLNRL
jgi:toxin ParE1/3/4